MKGLTWKKIMSLVLVAALVIGCLQLNAKKVSAGSEATYSKVEVNTDITDPSNPKVTYSLSAADGEDTTTVTKTDVVLAIDLSSSMSGNNALTQAKAAANAFVTKLLAVNTAESTVVRIAIVTYGTKAANITNGFTANKSTLESAISGLEANSSNGGNGATNYDDAIEKAETVFKSSNNAKVLVFMSDGEPTVANGNWTGIRSSNLPTELYNAVYSYDWWYGYYFDSSKAVKSTYYIDNETNSGYYFDCNNTLYCRSNGNWYKAVVADGADDTVGVGNAYSVAIGNAAIAEADKAKGSDIQIYTILFKDNSTNATSVLDAIATSGKASVTNDALEKVYSEIADTVLGEIAGTGAYIEAELSKYVKYTKTIENITTRTANGKTYLKWYFGDMNGEHNSPVIPFEVDKEKVLEDYLANTLSADENGVISVPVTTTAELVYTKGQDTVRKPVANSKTVQFKLGVDFLNYKVVYTVDEGEGEPTVTNVTGTVVKDKVITVKTADELVQNPSWYSYEVDGNTKITVNNQEIKVNVTRKELTVKFREKNDDGEYVVIVDSARQVRVGDNVDTSLVTARNYTITVASSSAIYYWQETWNDGVSGEVQILAGNKENNTAYYFDADYDDGNEIFTVIFRQDGQDDKIYKGIADDVIDSIPEAVVPQDNKEFDYTFNGWKCGDETVQPGNSLTITGNKIYVADISEDKQVYTVMFVNDRNEELIDSFTVEYGKKIPAEKITAAEDAAKARATEKTDDAENKTIKYTFKNWGDEADVTADVVDDITFQAQFAETAKQFTVTFKYLDTDEVIGQPKTVDVNSKLEFISEVPNRKDEGLKFVTFGYKNEDQLFVPYVTGIEKTVVADEVVYLQYREIQKGTFIFWQKEAGIETTEKETRTFDEDTLSLVVVPNGPAKANKVEGNTTTKYTFDSWKTFMTNEEILERTPVEELQQADIVEGRVMRISDVNAPQAGTEEIEGVWITYAEYMEKYFRFEERNFYPTYTETTTTSNPDPDPVVTQIIILPPPVVTETPEEPTATPTEVPATPTPVEEEPIVVEEPETPEGDVELEVDEPETPEGAPEEEELDVEPIDTPQGDLPKTGVAPSAVFFGIGAACVVFG